MNYYVNSTYLMILFCVLQLIFVSLLYFFFYSNLLASEQCKSLDIIVQHLIGKIAFFPCEKVSDPSPSITAAIVQSQIT